MEIPPKALTAEKPDSSVASSPAKIGLRPKERRFQQERLDHASLVGAFLQNFEYHFPVDEPQIGL
jgi:hypothetical protein